MSTEETKESASRSDKEAAPPRMLSVWFFVSVILGVFGLLVLGVGISRAVSPPPPTTKLAELNPALWWGVIMVGFSAVLFFLDRLSEKKKRRRPPE